MAAGGLAAVVVWGVYCMCVSVAELALFHKIDDKHVGNGARTHNCRKVEDHSKRTALTGTAEQAARSGAFGFSSLSIAGYIRYSKGLLGGLYGLWRGTLGHTAANRQGLREMAIVMSNGAFEWGSPGLEAGLACPRRPAGC